MNKIPTIKNCMLKTPWLLPNGSNPHSYTDNFSNVESDWDKKKATKNKIMVKKKTCKYIKK